MALSVRSSHTMASIVRSSVRTQSWTEQVAEPSNDKGMRLHPSLEQAVHHPHNTPSKLARSVLQRVAWIGPNVRAL